MIKGSDSQYRPAARQAALQPSVESLPVLEAFQQFLEAERHRTRNRMLMLTGFFVVLLLLILGGTLFTGMLLFQRVDRDVSAVREDLRDVRTQNHQAQGRSREAVADLARQADRLKASLVDERTRIADVSSRFDQREAVLQETLAEMREVLDMLQVENSSLKQDLGELEGKWSRLAAAELSAPQQPATATTQVARTAGKSFLLSLNVPGTTNPVTWHLPIPE